ncbi:hypothetical protein FB451DRAFT_1390874 [Mycena latifolia]|nr:hypothetical protein FB451DRAFT_1390874 [Mycena latifolia]
MATLPDPDANIVCDVIFYPAAGGTARIAPMHLTSFHGPENACTLYYNMSPGLPINLAMARLVSADPSNPGERLLWRGDVCVVRVLPEGSNFGGTLGIHYLNVTTEAMDWFNSTLIPHW